MCKHNANPYPCHKPSPFMISAEGADGIEDVIYLPQIHTVHLAVQFVEVRLDPVIVHAVLFAVGLVQQGKYRIAVAEVRLVISNVLLQYIIKFVHIDLR